MDNIFAYIMICLVLVLSPGPNTVLIFSTASRLSKNNAFMTIAGLFSATYVHGLLSLFGVSIILLQSEKLFLITKLLGAAYLCYLGIKFIWQVLKKAPDNVHTEIDQQEVSYMRSFSDGFMTQVLNPKVSMFYIAAFPQFIDFGSAHYNVEGVLLITLHALIIASWFIIMTLFINRLTKVSSNTFISKSVSVISGFLLIYFSVLLGQQPSR